jgi:DNA polymerase V
VQIPLPVPTSSTSELLSFAAAGVEQIYREGFEYQKAGIMLSGLVPCNLDQFAMFDPEDRQKLKTVTVVMDEINKKMGRNTLFYAAAGVKKPWDMRREFESPHYTTRWKDLPGVKAE